MADLWFTSTTKLFHINDLVLSDAKARALRDWLTEEMTGPWETDEPPVEAVPFRHTMDLLREKDAEPVGRVLTSDDPEPPEGTVVTRQEAAYVRYQSGWGTTSGTGIRLAWSSVTPGPVTVLRWGWGE